MSKNEAERSINIIRGSIDSLTFYEVTEDELVLLENGPSSSIYLNLAIALLSSGLSFLVSILTVKFDKIIIFIIFLVLTILFILVGVGYLLTWFNSRKSFKTVINKIKARTNAPDNLLVEDTSISPEVIKSLEGN